MNIMDGFIILAKNKRFLILVPFLSALVTFISVSFFPKSYYTEMRLRVDDPSSVQQSMFSDVTKNLNSFFGRSSEDESIELFLELVSGRENLVAAIKKFQLDTLYQKKSIDLTLKALSKDLNVDFSESGIIFCGFECENRELSISLIEYIVNEANRRYIELKKERLIQNTDFLVEKRRQLIDSLDKYNEQLIQFYNDNNIVNLEKQVELSIMALSNYESQIKVAEIEQSLIRKTVGNEAPMGEKYKQKLKILQHEFDKLRGKPDEDYSPLRNSIFVNTDWGLKKILTQKLIEARIGIVKDFIGYISKEIALSESQASKNIPVVQIIQNAYFPDWKTKPKRLTWAVASIVVSLMMTLFWIFLRALLHGDLTCDAILQSKIREFIAALKI